MPRHPGLAFLQRVQFVRGILVLLMVAIMFRACAFRSRYKSNSKLALFGSYIDANKAYEKHADSDGGFNQGLGKEALLFEDEDLLVFNKPHNAQTAPGYEHDDSLASRVAKRYQLERVDQLVVHRLDYATSGVIVFARNVEALRDLHRQFREAKKESERSSKSGKHGTGGGGGPSLYKQYSAIVRGCLPTYEGEVSLPLGPELENKPLWKVDPDGKESLTLWRVLAFSSTHTHVQLRPLTGRTHQLRIHMASIGHPILGDFFYSPPDVYNEAPRLLLHAEVLGLLHPRTKKQMRFVSPTPFSLDNLGRLDCQ